MATGTQGNRDVVVIGASAGAVTALRRLVSALPPDFPGSIFVTVHLWQHAESLLPEILSRAGPLPAEHGVHGAPIRKGRIYLAPNDQHLMLENDRIFLSPGPRENRFRPAINPLFRSAALAYRQRVVGVILTGVLDDGVAGLWTVKQCGGIAIVQSDAEYSEMSRQAAEQVKVDYDVPLADIAPLLVRLAQEPAPPASSAPIPETVRQNDAKMKMKIGPMTIDRIGIRSVFSCPDCNGALWEVREGTQLSFACHVGHTYTPQGLAEAQGVSIEQALWSAIRSLKENAVMHDRLATTARVQGLPSAAQLYHETAEQRRAEAGRVQGVLAARAALDTRGG